MLEPELLVADEPVSMLDVSVRAGILTLLDELRRSGLGILMITHDLSTAAHFADRIAVMYLGPDRRGGARARGRREPAAPVHEGAHLGRAEARPARVDRAADPRGRDAEPDRVPPGCRFHPRCPIAIPECRQTDPELRVPSGAPAGHLAACIRA